MWIKYEAEDNHVKFNFVAENEKQLFKKKIIISYSLSSPKFE